MSKESFAISFSKAVKLGLLF
uniref:Uncharacterized protein n=1 Tax=Rhizophora mucronata TaxID=61149 RepID=A0A2P2J282_RHIMU